MRFVDVIRKAPVTQRKKNERSDSAGDAERDTEECRKYKSREDDQKSANDAEKDEQETGVSGSASNAGTSTEECRKIIK